MTILLYSNFLFFLIFFSYFFVISSNIFTYQNSILKKKLPLSSKFSSHSYSFLSDFTSTSSSSSLPPLPSSSPLSISSSSPDKDLAPLLISSSCSKYLSCIYGAEYYINLFTNSSSPYLSSLTSSSLSKSSLFSLFKLNNNENDNIKINLLCDKNHSILPIINNKILKYFNKIFLLKNYYNIKIYSYNKFNNIRNKFFLLNNNNYIDNLLPYKYNILLSSDSKSGSQFYYNNKFIIKTIKKYEYKKLKLILNLYINYLNYIYDKNYINTNNNNLTLSNSDSSNLSSLPQHFSLLNNILGLYRIKRGFFSRPTYLLVTRNVFSDNPNLLRRFDLKGSLIGRLRKDSWGNSPSSTSSSSSSSSYSFGVYKDLDLIRMQDFFIIDEESREILLNNLKNDLEFLTKLNFIDYSLLVEESEDFASPSKNNSLFTSSIPTSPISIDQGIVTIRGKRNRIYRLGIIDYLQEYTFRKKIEYYLKSFFYQSSLISCVPPHLYSLRFFKAISNFFQS